MYIELMNKGMPGFEKEILTADQKYNEYIMTSLRTIWGCDLNYISSNLGPDYKNYFKRNIEEPFRKKYVMKEADIYKLTDEGKLFADAIASGLFKL